MAKKTPDTVVPNLKLVEKRKRSQRTKTPEERYPDLNPEQARIRAKLEDLFPDGWDRDRQTLTKMDLASIRAVVTEVLTEMGITPTA